jgi:hypothetical protein
MSGSPLTDEQFKIIVAHLGKFHPSLTCPFCGLVDRWSIEPIGVIPDYGPGTIEGVPFAPQSGRMYVAVTCRRCFYTYHFSWIPMKRAADAQEVAINAGNQEVFDGPH